MSVSLLLYLSVSPPIFPYAPRLAVLHCSLTGSVVAALKDPNHCLPQDGAWKICLSMATTSRLQKLTVILHLCCLPVRRSGSIRQALGDSAEHVVKVLEPTLNAQTVEIRPPAGEV